MLNRITHYAGDVTYCIIGFLDKNKDTLFQDFKRLLFNSTDSNLKEMWPEGSQHITQVTNIENTPKNIWGVSCYTDNEETAHCRNALQDIDARTSQNSY